MKRKWFVALGMSFVAAIALAAGGSTILIDDFDDGNSDGWEERDFSEAQNGVFEVSSGAYVLRTTAPIPITDLGVGTLDADWEASEGEPRYANGTMRGIIRANTDGTTVGFSMRENHEFETAYGFWGSTSFGTFYIDRFDLFDPDGPQTIIAMADPEEFPFEVGVTYILEASLDGHKLTLKAWPIDEEEPSQVILSLHDREFDPESGTGLAVLAFFDPLPLSMQGVTEVEVNATVDDLEFIPAHKD